MPSSSSSPRPLSPERWDAVLTLFHSALDRPTGDRDAFLRAACGDDDALFREVVALLDADAVDDTLLRTDAPWVHRLLTEQGSMQGERVGPYHLDAEIGRGGMGVVYRARRPDVETTVAVKFLGERFPSAHRLQRFLAEQRTLGRLEHPGIARLLDASVTEDGTPFFVMEYVEGVPITDYCDAHALDLADRLRLFQQVCTAVRYAHANLVVHRDLKPSNVLVADGADGPRVKLLDFGIAKLLADDGDAGATRSGERLLTPAYAAPEQVGDGAISTATDGYALGVLLYELLTGARPIDVTGDSLSTAAMRILNETPAPPSGAAVQAEAPLVPPASLRGDLDTICAVALRKDPARRYASVDALSDDVDRFLSDRPILARADAWTYRAAKFVRRHRTAVAATLAVLLGVALLVTFYTRRLADERDRATEQASIAESVTAFLVEMLEEGNPNVAGKDTLTVYEIIERAEDRSETLDQPLVRANILDALGRVRYVHGQIAEADSLFRRALALRRSHLSPNHPDLTTSLNHLAQLRTSEAHYSEADSLIAVSLTVRRRAFGTHAPELATPTRILAMIRYRQGRYHIADSLFSRALDLDDGIGLTDQARATTYQQWGMAKFGLGDYDAAASKYQKAIGGYQQVFPAGHPVTASAITNLASIERIRGNYEHAVTEYGRALSMTYEAFGPRHINVALIKNNLAVTYYRQGHLEKAAEMMAENLALRQDLLGHDHPDVATTHNNLGQMLIDLGRVADGETHLRTALRIRENTLGREHAKTVTTLNNLAGLHEERGDLRTAETMRRDVLRGYRDALGPEHPRVGLALSNLGGLLHKTGAHAEAESTLVAALDLRRRALGPTHHDALNTQDRLATLYVDTERYADAEPLLVDAYAALRRTHGPDADATAAAESTLVALYAAWGRPARTAQVRDSLDGVVQTVAASDEGRR